MLSGVDMELAMSVTTRQRQCKEACETAIRTLRSEHPDRSYTRQECTEVFRMGEEYIELNTAAALAERHYSLEGIEHYQEQQRVC